MGDPPLEAGALKLTLAEAVPRVAETPVGGPGTVASGVTGLDAPEAGPVELANGLRVIADYGIGQAPACDLVIVTGGPGWSVQANAPATLDYIRGVHASGRIASVCTGGMILAASGILDGAPATTKREVTPPEIRPLDGFSAPPRLRVTNLF